MTQIKFHVEGGAGKNRDTEMRQGFRTFFAALEEAVRGKGNTIRFVLHGSRREAYDQFCHALRTEPDAHHVLLVDAEGPVAHRGECWRHLRERQGDQWARPGGVEDAQCQLMAQAIEAWLFTDPAKLKEFYGADIGTLPGRQDVEQVPKADHLPRLEAATRQTAKGQYHKTRHLPKLLGRMDAAKVRQRAWHCDRIFVTLSENLGDALPPLCTLTQKL